jgi:hypothetical protein
MDDGTKDKLTKLGIVASGVTLVIVLIVILYKLKLFGFFSYSEATILGAVVLIGLALVVLLMALLVMIYAGIGVANHDQPLGLPEGSVRALLAFSLVLIFVLLGAFLFTSVSTQGPSSNLSRITKAQLDELGKDYVTNIVLRYTLFRAQRAFTHRVYQTQQARSLPGNTFQPAPAP